MLTVTQFLPHKLSSSENAGAGVGLTLGGVAAKSLGCNREVSIALCLGGALVGVAIGRNLGQKHDFSLKNFDSYSIKSSIPSNQVSPSSEDSPQTKAVE